MVPPNPTAADEPFRGRFPSISGTLPLRLTGVIYSEAGVEMRTAGSQRLSEFNRARAA